MCFINIQYFQWDGKKVSTLAKSGGTIYVLADSCLPVIDEVSLSPLLPFSLVHFLHSNVVYSQKAPVMKNGSSQIPIQLVEVRKLEVLEAEGMNI